MDDDEPVDPKALADARCAASFDCAKLKVQYDQCASRIEAKGEGQCTGQYMDFISCIDHCASKAVMSQLR